MISLALRSQTSRNPIDDIFILPNSIPLCKLVEQYFYELARKFPCTKFLKSISSVCIPNYPDKNLPTVFVYQNGEMKKQFVGPLVFGGMNLKKDGKIYMLLLLS